MTENAVYLAHVRKYACVRCDIGVQKSRTLAHHWAPLGVGGKGTSMKHDDWYTVPLCKRHHDEWHATATMGDWDAERCKDEFTLSLLRIMGDWIESEDTF